MKKRKKERKTLSDKNKAILLCLKGMLLSRGKIFTKSGKQLPPPIEHRRNSCKLRKLV